MNNTILLKRIITVSLACLFISSCLKKQDFDDPQVGPALNGDDVTQKMMSDVGVFSIGEMKKGEYSSLVQYEIIEENTVNELYRQDIDVENVTVDDQTGGRTYDLLVDFIDKNNPDNSGLDMQFQIKPGDDLTKAPTILFYEFDQFAQFQCKADGITCHNFQITTDTVRIDPVQFHESICADKERCDVNIKLITLDVLQTKSDGKKQKYNFSFVVAPQLPLLSRILKLCKRTVVKANPRNYLYEMCLSVRDFRVGTNTP